MMKKRGMWVSPNNEKWKAATFLLHLEGKAMGRMKSKEQEQQTGARMKIDPAPACCSCPFPSSLILQKWTTCARNAPVAFESPIANSVILACSFATVS